VRRKGLDINLGGRGERLVFSCMQGGEGTEFTKLDVRCERMQFTWKKSV
jgi:hypothetical protein